jgi:hypothetical protein
MILRVNDPYALYMLLQLKFVFSQTCLISGGLHVNWTKVWTQKSQKWQEITPFSFLR